MAADALEQFSLAAFFALLPGGNAGFVRKHFIRGFIQVEQERIPEFLYRLAPRQFAFFNFVQLFFKAGGEADVENILEAFDQ